jgi:hypothetical protein
MLPSPYLAKAIAEITRLDQAGIDLAMARGIAPAEKRRRAGHLARLRRGLRLPSVVRPPADIPSQPARIEPSPTPRRS